MTHAETVEFLMMRSAKGAFFATLESVTVPSMRKTRNPYFGRVRKHSVVNVTCNFVYGNSVNRQRGREGKDTDFAPEKRQWGRRIEHTTLVEHDGRYYVEAKIERSLGHVYVDDDGSEVDAEDIKPYLTRGNADRQGVDRPVVLRDYRVDNLVSITVDGERHMVGNVPTAEIA